MVSDSPAIAPRLVTSSVEFAELCHEWCLAPWVSIDTEFERSRTYYPRPALVQVRSHTTLALLDPLTIKDFTPFADVLTNCSVLKIMHSCSEDAEVLLRLTDALPTPLFDTQVAAAFAGLDMSAGYHRLASELLEITLDKSETRSNWIRRPLTGAQLHYAAMDVELLKPLHDRLLEKLDSERTTWCMEEVRDILGQRLLALNSMDGYRKIHRAWELSPHGVGALKYLYEWRDNEAQRRDLPRRFIVGDEVLLAVARAVSDGEDVQGTIADVFTNLSDSARGALSHGVTEIAKQDFDEQPQAILGPSTKRDYGGLVKMLQQIVEVHANQIGISPKLLAQRRVLEELVLNVKVHGEHRLPGPLTGWRRAIIGEKLLEALSVETS